MYYRGATATEASKARALPKFLVTVNPMFLIFEIFPKGQIILKCPYEKIVYPKIATKKFPRFLPWPLRRGQIKKIKALYYTN